MTFEWTGDDPDDEVWCESGDLSAHCECMSDGSDEADPDDRENWFCAVYRPSAWEAARNAPGNSPEYRQYCVFHSSDSDILPLTASAAKKLCELVMQAEGRPL